MRYVFRKIGVMIANHFVSKKFGKRNLRTFEKFIDDHKNWEEIFQDNKKLYVYKDNSLYTIEISDNSRSIEQEWVKKFPDKNNNSICTVHLKIGGQEVCQPINYMYLDGAKYFVPRPKTGYLDETESLTESRVYKYWSKRSIPFKLIKIIGIPSDEESLKYIMNKLEIQFGD